jgi:uncharacterized membrane protein
MLPLPLLKIYAFFIAFTIYSLGGAVCEHFSYWVADKLFYCPLHKKLINPVLTGFPLYGIGAYIAIIMRKVVVEPLSFGPFLEFITYAVTMTAIEYIAGLISGAGKHDSTDNTVKAWDYSDTFCNLDGIINLKHFICFGILGMIVTRMHPPMLRSIKRALA